MSVCVENKFPLVLTFCIKCCLVNIEHLSLDLCLCVCLSLSIYLYIYLAIFVSDYIYLILYIYIHLPINLTLHLYVSIYPSIYPLTHPSIHHHLYLHANFSISKFYHLFIRGLRLTCIQGEHTLSSDPPREQLVVVAGRGHILSFREVGVTRAVHKTCYSNITHDYILVTMNI